MNNEKNNNKVVINNEFDYSNIIPTVENIKYLVQYCDMVYKQFILLTEEDERKNIQFKREYKQYKHKKKYSAGFEVFIYMKSYKNSLTCKDLETFNSAVKDGNIKNVHSLDIKLNLDYQSGKGDNLIDYNNLFKITLKPYEIEFTRKSNNNNEDMNNIEKNINDLFKKLPSMNTIFCTKD